jgi:hypothetical protein
MIDSRTLEPATDRAIAPSSRSTEHAVDHPGRWLGGLCGAIASILIGVAAQAFVGIDPGDSSLDVLVVGLLGAPIGFALGRAMFPQARGARWSRALLVGAGIGLLAPPLGAIEIVLGPLLLPANPDRAIVTASAVLFLAIAIPVSYIAVIVTLPAGLLWAMLVKLIPSELPARLRAPAVIEPLGIRHALLGLAIWAIVVQLVTR